MRRARLVALAVGGFLTPWSALLAWWVAIALTRQTR
jgi:hypothetical protein